MNSARPAITPPKGLCIVTRCTSNDELVARLHPFCSEHSIFVTTTRVWEAGTESRFAITLADRTVVLHGRCRVLGAWTHSNNEFGKPGVKLGILELRGTSKQVFEQILAARARTGTTEIVLAAPRRTRPAKPSQEPVLPVLDGPTERTPQPVVLQAGGAIVTQPIQVDTTARSTSPPMPPRAVINGKPPALPSLRQPFGAGPIGTPGPRAPRGTNGVVASDGVASNGVASNGVVGLGRCPGAEESAAINARLATEAASITKRASDPTRPLRASELPMSPRTTEPMRPSEPTLVRRTVETVPPRSEPDPIAVSRRAPTVRLSELENARTPAMVASPPALPEPPRAPHSPYILPANPLSGLSDHALVGFVDCTLYEDTAVPEPAQVSPSILNRVFHELADVDLSPAEPVAVAAVPIALPLVADRSAPTQAPTDEPAIIVSPAFERTAQLPTYPARLPWRSIGTITGVAVVALGTALLLLFQTGPW